MRLRRQCRPVLWLLLPGLLAQLAIAKSSNADEPADALAKISSSDATDTSDGAPLVAGLQSAGKAKEIGTKDAPVDGRDGKPHAGPWVGKDADTSKKKKGSSSGSKITDMGESVPEAVSRLEKEGYGSGSSYGGSDDSTKASKAKIPEKNDGVMDDPNRETAAKGTTGTEGGVSEKSKKEKAHEQRTGTKAAKEPEAPKEVPPLPHSEQKRITPGKSGDDDEGESKSEKKAEKPKGAVGLEKPTDLPDHPRSKDDIPKKGAYLVDTMPYTEGKKHPPSPAPPSTKQETTSTTTTTSKLSSAIDDSLLAPLHSSLLALVMILVSEVGDKTFLVAALMAMRHDRLVVFTAAFSALIAMTVLSAVLGHAVPSLLPRTLVSFAAAALFLVFGAKMLREGLAMPKDSGVGEEMREVEAELEEKEHARSGLSALEAGRGRAGTGGARLGAVSLPAPPESPSSDGGSRSPSPGRSGASLKGALAGLNNLFSLVLSPAWVQTFVMTFLGEWGDRSQIATIAMAAGDDYWWVIVGALVGHGICTGGAVLGGRALAGKVSMRVVTLGGAIAFLVFGVIYLAETTYSVW